MEAEVALRTLRKRDGVFRFENLLPVSPRRGPQAERLVTLVFMLNL